MKHMLAYIIIKQIIHQINSKVRHLCLEIHVTVFCILLSQYFFHCFKCLFVYFSVNDSYFSHCYCVLSTDSNRNVI